MSKSSMFILFVATSFLLSFLLLKQLGNYSFDYKTLTIKEKVHNLIDYLERDIRGDEQLLREILENRFDSYETVLIVADKYEADRSLLMAIREDCNKYKLPSPDEYIQHLLYCSEKLNINPLYLDFVIKKESSRKLTAVNDSSGATGLIQFLNSTAKGQGTSTTELKNMNYKEQFEHVYIYIKNVADNRKVNLNDPVRLYIAIFQPSWLNKSGNLKLNDKQYRQNKALDVNRDGQITLTEFADFEKNQYEKYLSDLEYFRAQDDFQKLKKVQ